MIFILVSNKKIRDNLCMVKQILRTILAFMILCNVSASEKNIIIATGEFPPYISEKIVNNGPAAEVVRQSFKQMGFNVIFKFMPWKRTYLTAKENNEIFISAFWLKTKEKERKFYYSEKVYDGDWVFFHHKDTKVDWKNYSDLSKYVIGATKGFSYTKDFYDGIENKTLNVDWVNNEYQLLGMIHKKRIDIAPLNKYVGYYLLKKHYPKYNPTWFRYAKKSLVKTSSHLIFNRTHPDAEVMRNIFNKGLRKLKKSGQYDKIFQSMMYQRYKSLANKNSPLIKKGS